MRKRNVLVILVWASVAMARITITAEGPNGPVVMWGFGEKDETDVMVEEAIKWYKSTTEDLIRRLEEPNLPNRAQVQIIYALGELRARRATTVLIENINLVSRASSIATDINLSPIRPARAALVKIGRYASTMIMEIVGSRRFESTKVDGYAEVLSEVETPRYALMKLEERLAVEEDEKIRQQYEMVMARVREMMPSRQKGAAMKEMMEEKTGKRG
jgi:hypothetical protein